MKVILLKDHQGFKKGKTVEVTAERARYWIMIGVAKKPTKRKNTQNKNAAPKTEIK